MKRRWRVLVLVLLPLVALYLLLATRVGLIASYHLARTYLPGELQVERLEGAWLDHLALEGVRYREGDAAYGVERLILDWRPIALFRGALEIRRLEIAALRAELGTPVPKPESDRPAFSGFRFPLAVRVDDLEVSEVAVSRLGEPLVRLERVELVAEGAADVLELERFELRMPQGFLQVAGRLGVAAEAETALELRWVASLERMHRLAGQARITGNWNRLQLDYDLAEPVAGQLQLTLESPLSDLRWHLQARLAEHRLDQLAPDWPAILLGLNLAAEGNRQSLRWRASGRSDAGSQGAPYAFELAGLWQDEGDGWRLRDGGLRLPEVGTRISAAGRGMYGGATELELSWEDLTWPPAPEPVWATPAGTLQWRGEPQRYVAELAGALRVTGVPSLEVALAAEGDLSGFQAPEVTIRGLDGSLTGTGQLQWSPTLQWTLEVAAKALDPGQEWPEWPGRLDAALRHTGVMAEEGLELGLQVWDLTGKLRGYPVTGETDLTLAGERLEVRTLSLDSGAARLRAQGRVAERWDLEWSLAVPELAGLLPQGAGALEAEGKLSGARSTPRMKARLAGRDLALEGLRASRAAADLDLALAGQWSGQLTLDAVRIGEQRLGQVRAGLEGKPTDHRLWLEAEGADLSAALRLQGRWQAPVWSGEVRQADWSYPLLGPWRLRTEQPLLEWRPEGVSLARTCWEQDGSNLCAQVAPGADRALTGTMELQGFSLARLGRYLPPGRALETTLHAEVQWRLPPSLKDGSALAEVKLSPGYFQVFEGDEGRVPLRGGSLALRWRGDEAEARLRFQPGATGRLEGDWRVQGLLSETPQLQGRLTGQLAELPVLESLVDELEGLRGRIETDMAFAGPLLAPQLSGELRWAEGAARVVPLGLELTEIELSLRGTGERRVQLAGSLNSGAEGRLQLEGAFDYGGAQAWSLDLHAKGERLWVAKLPEAQVQANPDLRLAADPEQLRLRGEVHIPYARLRPRDFSGAAAPSKDVVRVDRGKPEAAVSDMALYSEVRVSFGDDVQFKGFGLFGYVRGAVTLKDEPSRLTRGRGVLEIREGRYRAYGQDLKIETGRLLFTDGPVDNPGLDIRAFRQTGEVIAGVRVTGTLRDPSFSLYSDPAMSESDQLAYLVLGRPLNQASSSEGAGLAQAATALGLGGSGLLAARIGDQFGLDEVTVGGGETMEEASLMVGKYLSPKLYVNYSVGLLEPINTLRIRYQLSRNWALQTEAGRESGADVLFTIER